MAPGPKKKEINTRVFKNMRQSRPLKNLNEISVTETDINEAISKNQNIETHVDEGIEKKYSKRAISSNWQKYEETHPNSDHDVIRRGEDFEILISYSEGAGTQLKLQDEKEWELSGDDKASIGINVKDLTNVVNSIPFHKLINLPADVLNEDFISEFTSFAEKWKESHQPIAKTFPALKKTAFTHKDVIESLDSSLNVIKNYENEPIKETVSSNSVLLDGKTENIIDSLASCLSLKTSEKKAPSIEAQKETQYFSDDTDLEFLLSLDLTLKNPVKEVEVERSKTEVEDWLNSIMDD